MLRGSGRGAAGGGWGAVMWRGWAVVVGGKVGKEATSAVGISGIGEGAEMAAGCGGTHSADGIDGCDAGWSAE